MSSIFYEIGLGYRLSAYTVDTDAGPIFKSEFHHECFLRHHAKKEMDL